MEILFSEIHGSHLAMKKRSRNQQLEENGSQIQRKTKINYLVTGDCINLNKDMIVLRLSVILDTGLGKDTVCSATSCCLALL